MAGNVEGLGVAGKVEDAGAVKAEDATGSEREGVGRRRAGVEVKVADRPVGAEREGRRGAVAEGGGAGRHRGGRPVGRGVEIVGGGSGLPEGALRRRGRRGRKAHAERNRSQQRGAPVAIMTPHRARRHPFCRRREPGRQRRGRRQAGRQADTPARSRARCSIVGDCSGHVRSMRFNSKTGSLPDRGSFDWTGVSPARTFSETRRRTHARFAIRPNRNRACDCNLGQTRKPYWTKTTAHD